MNTFLDTNLSKTKSFVIYGNLKDKIWCPDLLPRDIEHYLVKYLKSRGFEHVIFYGGAGTKGAYCHDEKSARFFFSGNSGIPLPSPLSGDFEEKENETGSSENAAPSETETASRGTGSQVSDALAELFGDYAPGDISEASDEREGGSAVSSTNPRPSSAARKVHYSYRGMVMTEFMEKIQPLMLKENSHMAVIFYNILTTDMQNSNLRDDILDIWEKNSKGNICLMLFPETGENEAVLVNRLRSYGLESKFMLSGDKLNPVSCIKIEKPGEDEVRNLLRYLAVVGTKRGNKIKLNYGQLQELVSHYTFLSATYAGRRHVSFESMTEISDRLIRFVDEKYAGESDWDGLLTRKVVEEVYGIFGLKNNKKPADQKAEKADWAVGRIAVELPDMKPGRSLEELLRELNSLVGLKSVKKEVNSLIDAQKLNQRKIEEGISPVTQSLHMVFSGRAGTGKTTVARLIGEIYRCLGVLSSGHLVESSRDKLVAPYVGQTAQRTIAELERARGGVLFIDEAYALSDGGEGDFGHEAIDTLVKYMEDHREDLVVIVAGYPGKMEKFIADNEGLQSRFSRQIRFDDYSDEELMAILDLICEKNQCTLSEQAREQAAMVMKKGREAGGERFGNARFVRNSFEDAVRRQATRLSSVESWTREQVTTLEAEDFQLPDTIDPAEKSEPKKSLQELLDELDQLIGLHQVKTQVRKRLNQVNMDRKREERGMKVKKPSLHMVFTGNPGTGKTTVARLIGELYQAMGILETGQLVEVGREDLVASYVGQTAPKTREVLDRARGGVLFIDEAYTLSKRSENDFGKEAIDTILRYMENNRDHIAVIVAGYPNEMQGFLESNTGLKSRFTTTVHFEDYALSELMDILELQCGSNGYCLTDGARDRARELLLREKSVNGSDFGNGRVVRNLLEAAILNQNDRISELEELTDEEMMTLTEEDFL
ncbi:MAG: AAA family ATPase [Acetatifactor sp.]